MQRGAAPRTTRGGQPCYSELAITTALTLRVVFRLPPRQTEGLIDSAVQLLNPDLPVLALNGIASFLCGRELAPWPPYATPPNPAILVTKRPRGADFLEQAFDRMVIPGT